MKIAIISDSHDNLANLAKAMAIIKNEGIALIIHCGDICTHETLQSAFQTYQGKVHLVFGNVDRDHLDTTIASFPDLPKIKVWGEMGSIEIDGKKLSFVHFPEKAKRLAASQTYDLVFYGHTHKPWEEKLGHTRLVNPGNIAGTFYNPSFAIYDAKTNKLELKILD